MIYRRRASSLHVTRVSVACAWLAALALWALLSGHPLVLVVELIAVLVAAQLAGVLRQLRAVLFFALPLVLLSVLINALLVREGLTVLLAGPYVPVLGQLDITLEAIYSGAITGLRLLVIVAVFGLYSAAVDPDRVLRLLRRFSLRSVVTATLTTRLVPLLARDGRRIAEAQRCRSADRAPGRIQIMRAVVDGALERSVDVAATLELRGFGLRHARTCLANPWSRHDSAYLGSTLVLYSLAVVVLVSEVLSTQAYPTVTATFGLDQALFALTVAVAVLFPLCDRRGVA